MSDDTILGCSTMLSALSFEFNYVFKVHNHIVNSFPGPPSPSGVATSYLLSVLSGAILECISGAPR